MGLFKSLKKVFGGRSGAAGAAGGASSAADPWSGAASKPEPAPPPSPRGRPLSERATIEPPVVDGVIIRLQHPVS